MERENARQNVRPLHLRLSGSDTVAGTDAMLQHSPLRHQQ